jgi:hypothetical protein
MGIEEKGQAETPPSEFLELVIKYFKKEGFKVETEKTDFEGFSGVSRKFDLIVQKGRVAQGVWVRDWKRTIGVNVVITLDMASDDARLSSPILVGEKFSDHAKSYANRRKIMLLTKRQIIPRLR